MVHLAIEVRRYPSFVAVLVRPVASRTVSVTRFAPVYRNVKVVRQPESWVTPSRSQPHVSPSPVEADPSRVTGEPVSVWGLASGWA